MSKKILDPFGIVDKLGKTGTPQQSTSGYGALPAELQKYFQDIAAKGSDIAGNASQYFAPQGINSYEQTAGNMMQPENFGSSISNYLNPFSSYLTDAIDTGYQSQFGALKQQADEAGAFGGSRYRTSMGDLDQSRLSQIGQLMAGQFNNSANQMQQGIGNLLGFGGLQRGVDLSQRQALPNALNFQAGLMNPLLGGSTQTGAISNPWGIDNIAKIAGGIGGAASAMSDERLKENISFHDIVNGFNRYVFNYIGDKTKRIGAMAQEVIKILPEAVIMTPSGYYAVHYDKLGFEMEVA